MTKITDHPHSSFQRISAMIQIPSVLKGMLYLGSTILAFEGAFRLLQDRSLPYADELMHITACPMIMLLTAGFKRFSSHDQIGYTTSGITRLYLVRLGFALGASTYLVWLATLAGRGWVAFPSWGWETSKPLNLLSSVALSTIGHLAVAMNEEQIFRGFGFDVWRQAIGPIGAATVLTTLFMAAHRPNTLAGLSGYLTVGAVCLGLRYVSGSVWAPVGYHWGWNLIQTGILGHTDAPSIRPALVEGPETWVGKNSPETGWITTILNIIILIGLFLWHRKRKNHT